jgi:type I restriction enzyme R subunit
VVVEGRAKYEPHVIPIGERAEEVAKRYEERHIATRQALEDYEKLAEQYVHAEEEHNQLGLEPNAFALYVELSHYLPTITPDRVKNIDAVFQIYPDYRWNVQQETQLRAQVYKLLVPLGVNDMIQLTEITSKLLNLERI